MISQVPNSIHWNCASLVLTDWDKDSSYKEKKKKELFFLKKPKKSNNKKSIQKSDAQCTSSPLADKCPASLWAVAAPPYSSSKQLPQFYCSARCHMFEASLWPSRSVVLVQSPLSSFCTPSSLLWGSQHEKLKVCKHCCATAKTLVCY